MSPWDPNIRHTGLSEVSKNATLRFAINFAHSIARSEFCGEITDFSILACSRPKMAKIHRETVLPYAKIHFWTLLDPFGKIEFLGSRPGFGQKSQTRLRPFVVKSTK